MTLYDTGHDIGHRTCVISPLHVGTKNRVTMSRFLVPTRDGDRDTGHVTETMTLVSVQYCRQ